MDLTAAATTAITLTLQATTAAAITLQATLVILTTPTAPTPIPTAPTMITAPTTTTTLATTPWTTLLMTIAHGMLDIMTTTTVHTLIPMVGKTTTTGEKKKNNTQDSTRVVDLPSSETWILPGTKLTHGVKPGAIKLALSMPIAMVETLNAVSLL